MAGNYAIQIIIYTSVKMLRQEEMKDNMKWEKKKTIT